MSGPLPPGSPAPPIILPGVPQPFDSRADDSPLVVEFHRGTW